MTLREYQKQAFRTCPDLGSLKLNLAHMVLGIMSEEEELLKALVEGDDVGIEEELADKLWYIAGYCTFRNLDLQKLYDERNQVDCEQWEERIDVGISSLSQLQDYVKKFLAYNKEINTELEQRALKLILWNISLEIDESDIILEDILQNNIDKLKVRYPEKFTTERALNRDLEAERRELEK